MPRRYIDRRFKTPNLDQQTLNTYLLRFQSCDLYQKAHSVPTLDSSSLFAHTRPLEIEIGCADAAFLCALAHQYPRKNFVGIEKSVKPLRRAVARAAALSLSNIKFIEADAHLLLPFFADGVVQTTYLHFPDPHIRPKFASRIVFTPAFLDQIYRISQTQGSLSVVTDHEQFFFQMLTLIEADSRFIKVHRERYLSGFEPKVKSRFQQLWESHDKPILRFEVYRC
jgi:tRNA (guanine-N7-)-methyltransferase